MTTIEEEPVHRPRRRVRRAERRVSYHHDRLGATPAPGMPAVRVALDYLRSLLSRVPVPVAATVAEGLAPRLLTLAPIPDPTKRTFHERRAIAGAARGDLAHAVDAFGVGVAQMGDDDARIATATAARLLQAAADRLAQETT